MTKHILTDAELHARQIASRRVTRRPDDRCTLDAAGAPLDDHEKCAWCSTVPPRAKRLLVNGLKPLTFKQVLDHRTAPPLRGS